ncbi:toll/interleukin-1 receptor domain-containing protein, partial [Frankia sp. CiP3]|uniref:toll/interleukin-1 receptor domain-containing protein n=1 Tax=Frankia sp. CiP3 TaxID=2880971 RepID=UPI001EF54C9F
MSSAIVSVAITAQLGFVPQVRRFWAAHTDVAKKDDRDVRTTAGRQITTRHPALTVRGGPFAAPSTCTDGGEPDRGRVFVTYAHESPSFKAAVAGLCEFLQTKGLDVHYDQQDLHVRRNWNNWVDHQLRHADYVVLIASPEYLAAAEGRVSKGQRLGVRSEYERLADLHHRDREAWTRKILPVILTGMSPEDIPLAFGPNTCDYYKVESFTDEGAADLLRVLLGL